MSRSFKSGIDFIIFEMPRVAYIMSVGKINISLLFRPSVIRGPWIKPPLVVHKNKTLFLAYAVVISDYQLDRIFII